MPPKKRPTNSPTTNILRQHLESAFKFPNDPNTVRPVSDDQTTEAQEPVKPPEIFSATPVPEETDSARIARLLKESLGAKSYQHCFDGKSTFRIEEDEVVVGVGSPFLASWMQKQFRAVIAELARQVIGPSARVRFDVDGELAAHLQTEQTGAASESQTVGASSSNTPSKTAEQKPSENGNRPGRQFARLEHFITSENTALAMMAVREVCDSPGGQYNPLYLHGGVGLGKTHLLEGIYKTIRTRYPALRVLYLTAEAFTNYFTAALRDKTLPSFRQRFRNVNVLLIDDLDFLENKRGIQEEFLHTYKQLESRGGQLVLAADRHPRLMPNLSEELMTRCLSGLVCRLDVPDQTTREQIAKAYAIRQKAELREEVLKYVATRFSRNVRELQGAINTLAAYARMIKRRVSLTAAKKVLADLERDCTRIVRMADVEETVCQFFGVTPGDLKSSKRIRSLTQPRMLAMFLIRKHTQAAYQEIGQYFGGRNHATVISAEKKVLGWLSEKTPIKIATETWSMDEVLETLERQLQAG